MKQFQCHKTVRAAKIVGFTGEGNETGILIEDGRKFLVPSGWVEQKGAVCGGYLVQYDDGYMSFSPAEPFEKGYTEIVAVKQTNLVPELSGLSFSGALAHLKDGAKVTRAGWNGKGMWLCLSPGMPDCPAEKLWAGPNREYAEANGGTVTVLPYITMKTADGKIVPWLASQTDLLAEDWIVLS